MTLQQRGESVSLGQTPATGAERRLAPRVATELRAELAIGTWIAPISVVDLSSGGCGLQILKDDVPSDLMTTAIAVVSLTPEGGRRPTCIVPVVLRNLGVGTTKLRLGFQFPRLNRSQLMALGDFLAETASIRLPALELNETLARSIAPSSRVG